MRHTEVTSVNAVNFTHLIFYYRFVLLIKEIL